MKIPLIKIPVGKKPPTLPPNVRGLEKEKTVKPAMTDEQLAVLGKQAAMMLEHTRTTWLFAASVLRLSSLEYRRICQAGNHTQTLVDLLRQEAENRRWTKEQVEAVFGSPSFTEFS